MRIVRGSRQPVRRYYPNRGSYGILKDRPVACGNSAPKRMRGDDSMFVIQLSDLHFPDEAAMPERCAKVVDSLVLTIRQSIRPKKEENVLIAVCGDLINKGSDKGLEQAEKVMAKLRDTLASQYKLTFAFVPGNHDLVDGSLERFQQFIAGYSDWTGDFTAHPCFHLTLEEPGIVFAHYVNYMRKLEQ